MSLYADSVKLTPREAPGQNNLIPKHNHKNSLH